MSWADYHRQRGSQQVRRPAPYRDRMPVSDALARINSALGEPKTELAATPAASALAARVQALEDENLLLREALGMTWESPREWKLTPMEAKFTGVLMRVQIAPKERLMTALYAHTNDPPSHKIIDVMASHVRAKLKPFGIEVRNKSGVGYYLAEIDKAA